MSVIKKYRFLVLVLLVVFIFVLKIALNFLLLAENGDTYDFFKIAYYLHNFNLNYNSKRHLFLPILLAPFNPSYYVEIGRIWINLFYFLSCGVFYKLIKLLLQKNKNKDLVSLLATFVFLTNIVVLENSFYILADTIFLFFNLLFIYVYLKHKSSKPIHLALIIAAAFYTRPEGILLLGALGVTSFYGYIKNKDIRKIKIVHFLKSQKNIIFITLLVLVFISPHFIRTQLVYGNFLYTGYAEDKAGFIFNINTLILRISNYLFGLGGYWLVPFILLVIPNFKKIKINLLILIVFCTYLFILFLWGPYLRLYSVPLTLLIIFVYTNIEHIIALNSIGKFYKLLVLVITFANLLLYIYCFQFLQHSDIAYSKFGKITAILFSGIIVLFLLYGTRLIKDKKNYLIVFTILIGTLNLFIFIDKFSVTRYKYYTIKQATFKYLQISKPGENMAYSTISAVEKWYLKDFEENYKYNGDTTLFIKFAKSKNIKYFVTTKEFGSSDNLGNVSFNKNQTEVIQKYKSPFFYGDTKLVKILNYENKK